MVQPMFIKFAGLVIKTLTKPLANQIKSKAASPGWIRECCLRYGRFHHGVESRAALRLAGHSVKSVKPVAEDAAVGIGATVFSELFIFSVAGAVLGFELYKKAQDDEAAKVKKDQAAAKERSDLEARFQALEGQIGVLTHALSDALHNVHALKAEHQQAAPPPKKTWW